MNIMNAVFGVGASVAPQLASLFRHAYGQAVLSYWAIAATDIGRERTTPNR